MALILDELSSAQEREEHRKQQRNEHGVRQQQF